MRTLLLAVTIVLINSVPLRAQDATTKPTPVVAIFQPDGRIVKIADDNPFDFSHKPIALQDLTRRMRLAATDANLKAVIIQAEEVRQPIQFIRQKNKGVLDHRRRVSVPRGLAPQRHADRLPLDRRVQGLRASDGAPVREKWDISRVECRIARPRSP